ncbi:hypothetical protein LINPERHAP2_LOCUS41761, partial [Linum perenne]
NYSAPREVRAREVVRPWNIRECVPRSEPQLRQERGDEGCRKREGDKSWDDGADPVGRRWLSIQTSSSSTR